MARAEVRPLLVVGAGGHAKVVVDAARASGKYEILGILDQDSTRWGEAILAVPILGDERLLLDRRLASALVVIAIGDNATRARVAERLAAMGATFTTVVHPSCSLGEDVALGHGTVVLAGVVVNSGSVVGRHVILNTSSSVDHDCRIGDFVHVSPGVRLAGGVHVGAHAHLGIGACAVPNVSIGAGSIVGAGAAVIADVADAAVVVGVPARPLKSAKEDVS
jgi:sugar O-acyltransferase (sialic acid O-acetyltransferase NeuD family)